MRNAKPKTKKLCQFYTKRPVAQYCVCRTMQELDEIGYPEERNFIEPSAGAGAFIRALEANKLRCVAAFDIEPKADGITKLDFLRTVIDCPKETIFIGNPPFGHRADLAIKFVNASLTYGDVAAFILPAHFQKYSAQSKIIPDAKLLYSCTLPEKSFWYKQKDFSVRTVFQIWTTRPVKNDLRIKNPPQTSHPDFEMWQYNCTAEALKYFNQQKYDWDFAVPRQGYKDYTMRATNPLGLDTRTQWIFFKAKDKKVLRRLYDLDFNALSHKNTSTPGFGKADVVQAYTERYCAFQ